jgi:hypothetical protein
MGPSGRSQSQAVAMSPYYASDKNTTRRLSLQRNAFRYIATPIGASRRIQEHCIASRPLCDGSVYNASPHPCIATPGPVTRRLHLHRDASGGIASPLRITRRSADASRRMRMLRDAYGCIATDKGATRRHEGRSRRILGSNSTLPSPKTAPLPAWRISAARSSGANGATSPSRVRVPTSPPSFMAAFWRWLQRSQSSQHRSAPVNWLISLHRALQESNGTH